jgi:hypothetical protein
MFSILWQEIPIKAANSSYELTGLRYLYVRRAASRCQRNFYAPQLVMQRK